MSRQLALARQFLEFFNEQEGMTGAQHDAVGRLCAGGVGDGLPALGGTGLIQGQDLGDDRIGFQLPANTVDVQTIVQTVGAGTNRHQYPGRFTFDIPDGFRFCRCRGQAAAVGVNHPGGVQSGGRGMNHRAGDIFETGAGTAHQQTFPGCPG